MSNTFGKLLKFSIFGESHGKSIGITIDGCPPGLSLLEEDFLPDLEKRKAGAKGTTARIEQDIPEIISGTFNGDTTGAPITILFKNENTISTDYSEIRKVPRPGQADFVAFSKYAGYNDYRGGGHFSGRLTLALVSAGVIAKKIIHPMYIEASLIEAGGKKDIGKAVDEAIKENDSIGGIVNCEVLNVPVGLGEPFFDSVESLISHAVFSIPAIKGIEFGAGFNSARMKGSEHNDLIINTEGKTISNFAGGINGGLTNGNNLVFNVAVKPTSSIGKPQKTINRETGQLTQLNITGRHDACIALRMPVIVEAVTACVLADLYLISQTY